MATRETYTTEGLRFQWSGGQYIDVYYGDTEDPFECINVYDVAGEPTIGNRMEFIGECEEWLNSDEELEEC